LQEKKTKKKTNEIIHYCPRKRVAEYEYNEFAVA